MNKLFTLASILLFSTLSFGFAGEWEDSQKIADIKSGALQVQDLKIDIYNYAETAEGRAACGARECFRMDVFINDEQIATWATSPGKPHPGTNHVGVYTPEYEGRSIHSGHVYGRDYISYKFKYSMPYVMYLRSNKLGIGIHAGVVNGTRLSHGCIRLVTEDARRLNQWVREVFRNGGDARVWARGTRG
ncbi:MAG: L,D-transpeptidase [Bdellovibrionales bacterium]